MISKYIMSYRRWTAPIQKRVGWHWDEELRDPADQFETVESAMAQYLLTHDESEWPEDGCLRLSGAQSQFAGEALTTILTAETSLYAFVRDMTGTMRAPVQSSEYMNRVNFYARSRGL